MTDRYDAVHSHAEGSFIGVVLGRGRASRHLYDMHSSLPQQLNQFRVQTLAAARRIFEVLERFVIRGRRVVIVICPHSRRPSGPSIAVVPTV